MSKTPTHEKGSLKTASVPALQSVADALSRLRYGSIQLIVHDGKLVQIDVTERQRFAP